MPTIVALYRGKTVGEARLIAVSADPLLAADISARLLKGVEPESDDVVNRLENGRRGALRLIRKEAQKQTAS